MVTSPAHLGGEPNLFVFVCAYASHLFRAIWSFLSTFQISSSQSVVPGPAASALLRELLGKKKKKGGNLSVPTPRPTLSETQGVGPALCVLPAPQVILMLSEV